MKSNAKTLLKVLVATAILCLFTAIGASAEVKTGTFTDANVASDNTYTPGNTYTYEFDTESGHLTIDAAKNADGAYAHDGKMTMDNGTNAIANSYLPWRNGTIDRTKVAKVTIGNGITKLGRMIFAGMSIEELTIPAKINAMEWGVAHSCTKLKKITIGSGVKLGDRFACDNFSLEDVYLEGPLAGGTSARAFSVSKAGENQTQTYINNVRLHFTPTADVIAQIGDIMNRATNEYFNFVPLANLPYVEKNGTFIDSENKEFTYEFKIIDFPNDYDFAAHPDIYGMLTVNSEVKNAITANASTIYPWVKDSWNGRINAVEFGDNITNVGRELCKGMTALENIELSSNITSLEWGAFLGCKNLKSFDAGASKITKIDNRVFGDCNTFDLYLPDTITTFSKIAFIDTKGVSSTPRIHWNPGNSSGTDKSINDNIFNSDTEVVANWANVTLVPNSVFGKDVADNGIGGEAVYNAIHFKIDPATRTLSITKNNTGNGKMADLDSNPYGANWGKWVEKVEIGQGIKRIGSNTFGNLVRLKSVTVAGDVEEIGQYTFNNCSALEEIVLNGKLKVITNGAINGCEKLKSVVLPKGLTSTENYFIRYSNSFMNDRKFNEKGAFYPDIAITVYADTGAAMWAHGKNSENGRMYTYNSVGKTWIPNGNNASVCYDVKVLNNDDSIKYFLLNKDSTSSLANEAKSNGYEIIYYGESPVLKLTSDSASAVFTGRDAKGILIATKHDSKGNMTAVQLDGVTAKSAGYYTIDFDDTFKAAEGTVTAMLWDGIDTMKPLCASVSK